jgi:hypothetical protein
MFEEIDPAASAAPVFSAAAFLFAHDALMIRDPACVRLPQYVHIGADEERHRSPMGVVPSRESYLALLDAFEAVYVHRLEPVSRHTWAYFGNLEGWLAADVLSDTDTEQRHQTVI